MKETASSLTGRAAELARAFDATFAEPLQAAAGSLLDLLAIRVGGAPLALLPRDVIVAATGGAEASLVIVRDGRVRNVATRGSAEGATLVYLGWIP